jgi:hypothetical protein
MKRFYLALAAVILASCQIDDVDHAGTGENTATAGSSESESSTGEPCEGLACDLPDVDVDANIEPEAVLHVCSWGAAECHCTGTYEGGPGGCSCGYDDPCIVPGWRAVGTCTRNSHPLGDGSWRSMSESCPVAWTCMGDPPTFSNYKWCG